MSYKQALYAPSERIADRHRLLKALLWSIGIVDLFYFTASHLFFPLAFFQALGASGPDLDSPFVISQLQLIGTLALGYSLMNFIIATDPERNRTLMALNLCIGTVFTAIFVGGVHIETLPAPFLINAMLLLVQIVLVMFLFPWISLGKDVK